MAYFNRDFQKFELDNTMQYLDKGTTSEIFFDGDIIFKKYFDIPDFLKINPKMFDILKDVNNPHFIKLIDIYSEANSLIELKELRFIVNAYTAKYYKKETINVLDESKDFILDNFRELEILFNFFSKNNIRLSDTKNENVVFNHENIIIIDPDRFQEQHDEERELLLSNKRSLLYLFKSILVAAAKDYYDKKDMSKKIFDQFDDIIVKSNTDVTKSISQKLKYVKKPIEILK